MGEAVGVGAGFEDGAAEGEAVDDGGAQAGVGEGLGPAMSMCDLPVPESPIRQSGCPFWIQSQLVRSSYLRGGLG